MGVSFNEEANVFIANDLTIDQRKKLWSCTGSSFRSNRDASITCAYARNASIHTNAGHSLPSVSTRAHFTGVANEERLKQQQRRNRIRNYVRFVVDEHKSIKAMGITETISLFRLSAACSKPDVIEARQRAMSVTKYNPGAKGTSASTSTSCSTTHPIRSRVSVTTAMTCRAF